jgi:hypothetical protein
LCERRKTTVHIVPTRPVRDNSIHNYVRKTTIKYLTDNPIRKTTVDLVPTLPVRDNSIFGRSYSPKIIVRELRPGHTHRGFDSSYLNPFLYQTHI